MVGVTAEIRTYQIQVTIVTAGTDLLYRGADKSLARPGKKQARKHIMDARDFDKIKTQAVINFFFLQGKAPKEIHTILTETLACFLHGRAKDLSAPLYFEYFLCDLFEKCKFYEISGT